MCCYCYSPISFPLIVQLVGQSLLWTLEQGLGKEFTTEVKAAWTAMYGLVATEMKEGLQEYKDFSDSL